MRGVKVRKIAMRMEEIGSYLPIHFLLETIGDSFAHHPIPYFMGETMIVCPSLEAPLCSEGKVRGVPSKKNFFVKVTFTFTFYN